MLISIIFAWLTVLFSLLCVLKFIARKTGSRPMNRFFHNIHIPFGFLALGFGLLHGVMAGNLPNDTLSTMVFAPELLSLNAGTIAFVLLALLALSYYLRKKLPFRWMTAHRILSIALVCVLVLHLVNTGISLPSRLAELGSDSSQAMDAASADSAVTSEQETFGNSSAVPAVEEATPAAGDAESAAEEAVPADEASVPAATDEADASPAAATEAAATDTPAETTNEAATAAETTESEAPQEAPAEETAVEEAPAEEEPEAEPVTFSGAELADGSYSGSAEGFKGTIWVTVTVSGGAVTDVTIDDNSDTPRFFDYAVSITDTIIEEQSLAVDTVTGATFSSAGILNAVYDALSGAVVSGELEITEIDLSSIQRHGH